MLNKYRGVIFSLLALNSAVHADSFFNANALLRQVADNIPKSITNKVNAITNQNNEQDYSIPEFKSLSEENAWKVNNQKDIDDKYESLIKRISESQFGKDFIVTAEDTPESIDQKYTNAEALYNAYNKQFDEYKTEYINLINRCSKQECSNERLIDEVKGLSHQKTDEYKATYIGHSLCAISQSDENTTLYISNKDDKAGKESTYTCASIDLFQMINRNITQYPGQVSVYPKRVIAYKEYFKGANSNIHFLQEKMQTLLVQEQQEKAKGEKARIQEEQVTVQAEEQKTAKVQKEQSKEQLQDYSIPKFKSFAEEKAWRSNNQKELDAIYESLVKRVEKSNFGKDLLVSFDDTPESIELKYQNAEMIYNTYLQELENLIREYKKWYLRCAKQECSVDSTDIAFDSYDTAKSYTIGKNAYSHLVFDTYKVSKSKTLKDFVWLDEHQQSKYSEGILYQLGVDSRNNRKIFLYLGWATAMDEGFRDYLKESTYVGASIFLLYGAYPKYDSNSNEDVLSLKDYKLYLKKAYDSLPNLKKHYLEELKVNKELVRQQELQEKEQEIKNKKQLEEYKKQNQLEEKKYQQQLKSKY